MAVLLAALVASDGFKLPLQGLEALMGGGEVEMFTRGILLSQGLSKKYGYEQLSALGKVAISSPGPCKLSFLIRYFQLLSDSAVPMPIYTETQICLLTKQLVAEIPNERNGRLGQMLLESTVSGLFRLLRAVRSLDSVKALKAGIEGRLTLLGEDVILRLSSEDSSFLSENSALKSEEWTKERVRHISEILQIEKCANRPTLLAPLLLIAIRLCTNYQACIPLVRNFFPSDQFTAASIQEVPIPNPISPNPKVEKQIPMLAGLKWLYGKVTEEAEQGLKSDFDQVQFELGRLLSGDGIRIVKSGKQDLFEAFDALMVSSRTTRETLSCWKVLLKSFGRLQVLETVEWRALQDKLARLADRNQYLRDIGKKAPNRPKRESVSFRSERKKASQKKRSLH